MKQRWLPFHYQIPLTEGEVPMDKGGFRAVTAKGETTMSALEAVVYCKDCIYRGDKSKCMVAVIADANGIEPFMLDNRGEWFCVDGKKGE